MEIPDVIVVNKKDHPAAKTMLNEVRSILAPDMESDWKPPIVLTEAVTGEGVPELWEKIAGHRAYPRRTAFSTHGAARTSRARFSRLPSARAKTHLEQAVADDPELRRLLDEVQRREPDPLDGGPGNNGAGVQGRS